MKNLFSKEVPLVEPRADALSKKEKRIATARKTEKFVNNHPYISTATLIGMTHVVAYGALAIVTRP